ncbi:MAG: hypothetical protein KDD46_01715 [Bdellovibrionales bacterium]|nr:hypothetical protein [Bdellovibrionales bacterium]
MKKILVLALMIFLQACGLALLDPNARNNQNPNTPNPNTPTPEGPTFTVGGTVSGLPRAFDLDGTINDLPYIFTENGTFTFPYDFADQTSYNVEIGTLPGGYTCVVNNGVGTIDGADVTDVEIVCSCIPDNAQIGDGTPSNPIEIWTATQLDSVATNPDCTVRQKHYKQMCDIDYTGINPTPIGSYGDAFTGSYNGQGFFISNYTSGFNDADHNDHKGLFGLTVSATLTDMNLSGFEIYPNANMQDGNPATGAIGALAAESQNTTIENIYVENVLISANDTAMECVGGVIGNFWGQAPPGQPKTAGINKMHVKDVEIHASLTMYVGGIIGGSLTDHALNRFIVGENLNVASCYGLCGGLIGNLVTTSNADDPNGFIFVHIENSSVEGNGEVGGLVGRLSGSVNRAAFEGTARVTFNLSSAFSKRVGGLVGKIYSSSDMYNTLGIADVFSGSDVVFAGPAYGGTTGTPSFAAVTYLGGQTCENCGANPLVSSQADVNTYYLGTDSSQTLNPLPWDTTYDWCLRPGMLPSLPQVPFSLCQ